MGIRYLNCFTANARMGPDWRTGALCSLVETDRGLLLVDTGPGVEDYTRVPFMMRVLQVLTEMPMDPQEAAVHQISRLGYAPADVRHIVLTHMHFDHCGGVPDFPQATVHVHRREYVAFSGSPRTILDLAYVRRHLAHRPELEFYETAGEHWYGFDAIRLPFDPEMWLVPLFGHSRGHCGVVMKTQGGWHFHVGGAAPIGFSDAISPRLTRLMVGPHEARLRAFRSAHSEMLMTTGHMPLDFFERGPS